MPASTPVSELLNAAFRPKVMAASVVGGVNLAVIYGFGLIGFAFVMALIYMFLCRNTDQGDGGVR